jgi:hypothetical protein
VRYLSLALYYDVVSHLQLAERTGSFDLARVLALCEEGETLCAQMEDDQRQAFFSQVRQQLQEGEP